MLKNHLVLRRILFALLILLMVISVSDYIIDGIWEDYLRGIFTETIGIILTIVLFEILLTKDREIKEKDKAKENLNRTLKLIDIYMNQFEETTFYISTTYSELKSIKQKRLVKNFPFNNLFELFMIYPDFNWVDINTTKADMFFERLDNLKKTIKESIQYIDQVHFKELSDLLLERLNYLEQYYPKIAILGAKNTLIGTKKATESDKEMIKNHKGPVVYKKSNAINKYVRLYEIINTHIDFSNDYSRLKGVCNK